MNKGSLRKRLLSLALAAVMMLGMVPSSAMTVFAAGEADNDPSKNAQVGVGDVISAAGVNGVDFKLQLQPMDVEGKIYYPKAWVAPTTEVWPPTWHGCTPRQRINTPVDTHTVTTTPWMLEPI